MSPPGPVRRWRHIREGGSWGTLGRQAVKAGIYLHNGIHLRILIAASPRLAMRLMNRQFQRNAARIAEMAADLAEAGYGGAA
ncbi:hypothetical protein MINTMi198_15540 [Mycobacterium intracellulare M.i.198]|nr:hypothetical protein MINTMi198_15540 [Mycobacterium intracellulare M.i.198]